MSASGEVLKIRDMSLSGLNASEHLIHSTRTKEAVEESGEEALCLPPALLQDFADCIEKLTLVLDAPHGSDKTADLHTLDERRNDLIVYLNVEIRTALNAPFPAKRAAAESLYIITKSFVGTQSVAMNQKTAHIRSLQKHLSEAPASEYLATLGLTPVMAEMVLVNEKYDDVSKLRIEEMAEKDRGNSSDVRVVSDVYYHKIITIGGAAAIIMPSDEATKFVNTMNNLIKETKTAYNQRMGQAHSHDKEKEAIVPEDVTTEE